MSPDCVIIDVLNIIENSHMTMQNLHDITVRKRNNTSKNFYVKMHVPGSTYLQHIVSV